jgi:hypothetical protein
LPVSAGSDKIGENRIKKDRRLKREQKQAARERKGAGFIMTYRMLVSDIDDTLLTDDLQVTPGTREALARAVKRGVVVTLATGRMFASAKRIARQIELDVPIITYQGSLVKTLQDEKVLYERWLPAEAARIVFAFAEQRRIHTQAYVDDRLFCSEDNEFSRSYSQLTGVPYEVHPRIGELAGERVTKILLTGEPAYLDRIREEIAPQLDGIAYITKSKPHYLEFTHPEGTKAHAVKFLAERFGIGMEEVIAVGDGLNDVEMVQAAGLGVAVGNAVDALKRVADHITASNNEEGVRKLIETFLL